MYVLCNIAENQFNMITVPIVEKKEHPLEKWNAD